MKPNKKVIALLTAIFIVIFLYLFFSTYDIIQQQSIPISFKVAPYVGISVDKDKLHFGTIPRGGSSKRMIFLYNDDVSEKKASLKVDGSIRSWVELSENRFKLAPNENKTIFVTVSVPRDADYGNYTANLNLNFIRL